MQSAWRKGRSACMPKKKINEDLAKCFNTDGDTEYRTRAV